MARPRKPTEVLELKGAFAKDPQRKRPIGAKSGKPIGKPPAHLSDGEKICWAELAAIAPAGVLQRENAALLELTARLLNESRWSNFGMLQTSRLALLKECLVQMGLTPAARSKVYAEPPQEDPKADKLAEFGPASPASRRVH